MRWSSSLLGFVLAFTVSLALTRLPHPFKSASPNFTKEEAVQKLGRRVTCSRAPDGETTVTRNSNGEFAVVPIGSRGTVRGLKELDSGGYFIVVYWDGQTANGPWSSAFGKDYARAGIIEE